MDTRYDQKKHLPTLPAAGATVSGCPHALQGSGQVRGAERLLELQAPQEIPPHCFLQQVQHRPALGNAEAAAAKCPPQQGSCWSGKC